MSMEAVAKFYERLKEDKALQEGMKDIQEQVDFIALAKGKGFEITSEELDTFRTEQTEKTVPLSDDELDKAAGGFYSEDGYMITTIFYGCSHWSETSGIWWAARGQCGSCCRHARIGSSLQNVCIHPNNRRN